MSQKMTKLDHNILAEGEATGHFHRAQGHNVSLWAGDSDSLFLRAPQGATIVHEEHKPVTLPPGNYVRSKVLEYDHFAEEAREVID
jgi:hypothetical protein